MIRDRYGYVTGDALEDYIGISKVNAIDNINLE
jgi:hypothetical protein